MNTLDAIRARRALQALGEQLARTGSGPIEIVLAGSAAALLAGDLSGSRTTGDCDVIWNGDAQTWSVLAEAAAVVATRLDLAPDWLNSKCTVFAWSFPFAWRERCEAVGEFGPLRVKRLSRRDLIATKVVAAVKRARDLQDLLALAPTTDELKFVDAHLDMLESEDLDRQSYDAHRQVVRRLRGAP